MNNKYNFNKIAAVFSLLIKQLSKKMLKINRIIRQIMNNFHNYNKLTVFRLIINKLSKKTLNNKKIKMIRIMKTKRIISWIKKEIHSFKIAE